MWISCCLEIWLCSYILLVVGCVDWVGCCISCFGGSCTCEVFLGYVGFVGGAFCGSFSFIVLRAISGLGVDLDFVAVLMFICGHIVCAFGISVLWA